MSPEPKSKATGGFPGATLAQQALFELLELSLGSPLVVEAAVAHALAQAGRAELPADGAELLGFVRAHLVAILTSELGPRLTITLLDDLATRLDPGPADAISEVRAATAPPFSGPRPAGEHPTSSRPSGQLGVLGVLLIDPNRVARTALARALLRARWNVTVVDTHAELLLVLDAGEHFAVALVDTRHPEAMELLGTLAVRHPGVSVVARTYDPAHLRGALEKLGVTRFDLRSADAPAEELVDAIRRTLTPG